MKFIYLDKAGNQVGPVDESAVVQRILSGELNGSTAIRNALLREFRTVAEFECFAEALEKARPATAISEAEVNQKQTAWTFLRNVADKRLQEEQNQIISSKRHAANATLLRRVLALLLDIALLFPMLALIFVPFVMSLKHQGTQDVAEVARQRQALEIRLFTSPADRYRNDTEITVDAAAALEDASREEKTRHIHNTNRALVNKMLPSVMQKVDRAFLKHNERIEKAKAEIPGGAPQTTQTSKTTKQVQPDTYNPELAEYETAKKSKAHRKAVPSKPTAATYKSIGQKYRPQVLVRNMPGGMIVSHILPTMMIQWEDRFYADGLSSSSDVIVQNDFALRNFLITGCAQKEDGLLLRTGGDIRSLSYAEISTHFAKPLRYAALVLLLYYTLAFSIFAQTVGMWFWGIFLTRSQLAEVLPLRALLYTMTMLIFGIFMIPAVLITRRSVADWICGVRQVEVASVSKSS